MSKSRNDSNRQRSAGQDGVRHRPHQGSKRPMNDRQLTQRIEEFAMRGRDFDDLEMEQQ